MNDLAAIEHNALALDTAAPVDAALALLDRLSAAKARLREVEETVKAAVIAHIDANGPIPCGPNVEWRVTEERTTKCIDVLKTMNGVFYEVGGSVENLATFLVAQPFKPGAVRSLLKKEDFENLFAVEVKRELVSGKPRRKLAAVDKRYMKSFAGHDPEKE